MIILYIVISIIVFFVLFYMYGTIIDKFQDITDFNNKFNSSQFVFFVILLICIVIPYLTQDIITIIRLILGKWGGYNVNYYYFFFHRDIDFYIFI